LSNIKDNNLLFLICQPRSGSSLVQQLLLKTKYISTVPEPWLMLPIVQIIKDFNIKDGYNPHYAYLNFRDCLNSNNFDFSGLHETLKNLALKQYNLSDFDNEKKYFLDKTPRYYHIISEIKDIFPKAKILILIRNPLAVYSSILDYNYAGNLNKMFTNDRINDLLYAPRILSNEIGEGLGENEIVLRFEDLVVRPLEIMNSLMSFLKLPFIYESQDLYYEVPNNFVISNGIDKKSLLSNQRVTSDYLFSWKISIDTYQKKKVAISYLEDLGPRIFQNLGYDYKKTYEDLIDHKVRFNFPFSYKYLTKESKNIKFLELLLNKVSGKLNRLLKL